MNKRKICVVTGTRAEYGLLYWLMRELKSDQEIKLQIIVTGMHLSPEFGLTYKEIEKDDISIEDAIELFEKGVSLTELCREKLKNAEVKVNSLNKKYDL